MTPLPKATCPLCHGKVALRRGGELREHQDHRHELYGTGRGSEVPKCPASGLTIEEVIPLAKIYIGEWVVAGSTLSVTVRAGETEAPLEAAGDSPRIGFACGRPASEGAAALARSILRDYLGSEHPDLNPLSERFEVEVVAALAPTTTWRLTGEQIATWLDRLK